jgi:D-alanine transaminase
MQLAMIQDDLLELDKLNCAHTDRGLYFGDGVYEVIRSYNGKLFALEEHMQRFGQSLAAIDITGVNLSDIRARIRAAFQKSAIANAKIYWHITRGSGPRDHAGADDLKPNFFLTVNELHDETTAIIKKQGIAVSTHPDWRWRRCDIKSLNLLANVLACRDAKARGCQEAILYNENSIITEGSSSAFFIIADGKIQTTPLSENILPSITRIFVLSAAKALGIDIVQKKYSVDDAAAAQEMFIAVTTKDVVPVVSFDGKKICDGRPGRLTQALMAEFRMQIEAHCT